MKSILTLSLLLSLSASARADDAFWPNHPQPGTPFNGGGIDPATAAINKEHQDDLRRGIIANGGCNADLLPVWVAQGCGAGVFTNADATGDSGSSGSGSGAGSGGAAK